MVAFVAKSCGKVVTALCVQRIDDGAGHQHSSLKRSAVCFNTAGNIDRIADDRQFQVPVTADITLHDIAIVDAYGNTNRRVTGSIACLVPPVD